MHSCIYEGTVAHARREPVAHQFQNRLFMVYLDLDELPTLVGRDLIADRKYASSSFMRSDHLFSEQQPLTDEVRQIVRRQTGATPVGRIRLLSQLRYFGYYFSPLNLFYIYDSGDERVEYVVAEVSNTPWSERHCYVLWAGNRTGNASVMQFSHPKEFHVSPFMGMDMQYRWQLTEPSTGLSVELANIQDSRQQFGAQLKLQRRELSKASLRRMTVRYPMITAQVTAAIYIQALKLWWKKCPFYTHPQRQQEQNEKQIALSTALAIGGQTPNNTFGVR